MTPETPLRWRSCDHPRTPENSKNAGNGYTRCRICFRKMHREGATRRRVTKDKIISAQGARIAQLEAENARLRGALAANSAERLARVAMAAEALVEKVAPFSVNAKHFYGPELAALRTALTEMEG